jgi:Flp pilus assembly protein TadD
MTDSRLDDALEQYQSGLDLLESDQKISQEQILGVLLARDEVQAALAEWGAVCPESLMQVNALDGRLKQQAERIRQELTLSDWHRLVGAKEEAWWWLLQPASQQEGSHDWVLKALSVTFLTIALGLVSNMAPRFWSGGPDVFGGVAIAGQSLLTLLAAGGVLTKAGQEGFERLLARWKQPKQHWQKFSCGASFLLMLALIGFRLSLPQIASYYSQQGADKQKKGEWVSAQEDYQRAIQLDPDNADAHFGLGVLYEDLQDLDKARSEYRIALQAGNAKAFNNLARLYILEKKFDAVILLLNQAEALAQGKNNPELNYALRKNGGWVRLQQARYAEAESHLRGAVELIPDRAAAHCLLAQVLDKQNLREEASTEWEVCLRKASSATPEEDAWMDQARKRLKQGTKK